MREMIVDLQMAVNEWNFESSGSKGLRESVPVGPKTAPGLESVKDSVEVSLISVAAANSQVKIIVGMIFRTRFCGLSGELASVPSNQSEMNPLCAILSQPMRSVTAQEASEVGVSTRASFFICRVEFGDLVAILGEYGFN